MKISARNKLQGTVSDIKRGAVMANVSVKLKGGESVHAAIFVDSVDDLGLKPGDSVVVVVKSTDVMLATP